jgi:hypothetical protein
MVGYPPGLIHYYSAATALSAEDKMPRLWCDCSNTANRAVKANELSSLSDEEASAFFHAFSTVPPFETEESDRKMTAEENRETEETIEAVRYILSSTSILCDFTETTNVPKCQCGWPAQTRPVRFIKVNVGNDNGDDNDHDEDDDELWPACKGNYPSTHCFICAAKDGRQVLKNPSSCECGMEAYKSDHKICYKCEKESNKQKDCSNIGCDKKRHLILTTCKNHYQRADTEVVACEICGETRSLQVCSKGKQMSVCTRKQNEACFPRCRAKNASGERCPNPRYKKTDGEYGGFCGSVKCKSGSDFKLRIL